MRALEYGLEADPNAKVKSRLGQFLSCASEFLKEVGFAAIIARLMRSISRTSELWVDLRN